MTCERYQSWAALAASGDLTVPERRALDEHAQTCAECRLSVAEFAALSTDLAELRDTEIDPAVYSAIRRNVRNQLPNARPRRNPWWVAWPAAAAVVAALLILLWPRPTPPRPDIVAVRQAAVPPPATRVVPAIQTLRKHAPARSHRARLVKKEEPAQPLVVKMLTDDPNVVIIWLVDKPEAKQGE